MALLVAAAFLVGVVASLVYLTIAKRRAQDFEVATAEPVLQAQVETRQTIEPPRLKPSAPETTLRIERVETRPSPLPRVTRAISGPPNREDGRQSFSGTVTRVVDGDTIDVSGAPARVRLIGIDAPEAGTPQGQRSKSALAALAAQRKVDCVTVAFDKFGRVVAKCRLSNGDDLSRIMLDRGAAEVGVDDR